MQRLAHLRALARWAVRGARAPAHRPATPRRKPVLEVVVSGDARQRARYLAATGGERLATDGDALPPLFCTTWEATAALELLASLDPPLPLAPIVHVEQEHLLLRPLRTGEPLRLRLELDRTELTRGGLRLTLASRLHTPAGQLCVQATHLFLVRIRAAADRAGGASGRNAPAPDPATPSPAPGDDWREIEQWRLGAGAGRRYALASGDFNPIHLWSVTARPFGFRRPILHGACTAARAAHSVIHRHLHGDAGLLRRFRVSFVAPLPLPARVCLLTARGEDGTGCFRLVAAEGETVFAEGTFNLTEAQTE